MWPNYKFQVPDQKKIRYIIHTDAKNEADDQFTIAHAVEALYTVLAHKGFFPLEDVIDRFSKFGSPYIGHPNNKLPGIEMNSGSLGHAFYFLMTED